MSIKKLTLSVDEHTIEKARIYSKKHNTSISRLVSGFLDQLAEPDEQTTPRVQRLMGLLPSDLDEEEYQRHLDEKYRL